jgi:SEC-C motif domain protein
MITFIYTNHVKLLERGKAMDSSNQKCPCCSGKTYKECCRKYHQGALAENALLLMRSRYSAYALGVAPYIIATTHPSSPHYVENRQLWLKNMQQFYEQVNFNQLEILNTSLNDQESFVTFVAHLSKGDQDLTFTEKSRFIKEGNAWLYVDGKIEKGRKKR